MFSLAHTAKLSPRMRRICAACTAAFCAAALAACGGDKGPSKPVAPQPKNVSLPKENPKDFQKRKKASTPAAEVHNRWMPVKPGVQTVREGYVNVGHRRLTHRLVYTVTSVTKKIDGVNATIATDQDFNGGELSEQSLDYLAEDKDGNVHYLGSYTEVYEGGQFVNATDGWLAGVNGSKAGLLMRAKPKVDDAYYESKIAGSNEQTSPSQVVKTGASKCVPFKCYKDVVIIQEGGSGSEEWKYYAPGVGGILTEPRYSGGEQETEKLVNATQLSKKALDEISREVLKVDRHAPQVFPSVFANAARAKLGT
jgi:hypothetical protein